MPDATDPIDLGDLRLFSQGPPHAVFARLQLEDFARRRFERALDRALELGRCDFVEDVASQLPLQVIAEMMGVPENDRPELGRLAHRVQGFDDPDLEADVEGHAMDDAAFASFFMLLITAGIETTKAAISGGMLALLEHPDEWKRLRERPEGLPAAVEEMIRWVTPIQHFRRTATRETEIRGQRIRAGDKVVIWYASADRDEAIFEDPFRFDVGRAPNEHPAFGFGRHFCLGANLARLEMRVAFETMLARSAAVERVGEVEHLLSSFTNALKRMPVELRATG